MLLAALSVIGCGARTGLLEPEEPVDEAKQEICVHPEVVRDCQDGWCRIPAGCFYMGSPPNEPCREDPGHQGCGKETRHQVTLTHSFEIMDTEVTNQQFHDVVGVPVWGWLPGTVFGHDRPNEHDWHLAVAYCNQLSDQGGLPRCFDCKLDRWSMFNTTCSVKPEYAGARIHDCPGYRLPTEAEWEYAYRAGTTTAYYSGPNDPARCTECARPDELADEIAWHCLGPTSNAVAQKKPNPWGLYDMAGNVWEWTLDGFKSELGPEDLRDPVTSSRQEYHVIRGGSYFAEPMFLRASFRSKSSAGTMGTGSRCARTLHDEPAQGGT